MARNSPQPWRADPDPKYRNLEHPVWNKVETFIAPFHDSGRELLPTNAWSFIWYFAKQAKWPFIALLVVGGLVGAVDAALYWGVGWLIDILDASSPATLIADHWHELFAFGAILLVFRAVVMIAAAIVEQQIIVPRFYTMVRWQAFRRVIEQPYEFYQDDFAGRIATKIMQAGESVGDFIVTSLQSLWSFATFILLTVAVLTTLDWRMGVIVIVWAAGYGAIVRYLLPRLRAAGKNNANERSVLNGRMVDIFTNILTVKLFDTGRKEHGDVKTALSHYLGAVTHLTRMITLVRTAVAVLNGLMMTAVAVIAVQGW
ncbi:MAG: ABC transporter transmembrane domain-containing protein, partial [Pseudomonadota bacterium]